MIDYSKISLLVGNNFIADVTANQVKELNLGVKRLK